MQEETAEISPAELTTWGSLVGVVLWLPAALDTKLKPHGLSHSEFQILWWLSLSDKGCRTMGDLADAAGVRPSHLSRIAGRLEKQGWMLRRADPADARFTVASLTESGSRKVAECLPDYYAAMRENLFDLVGKDEAAQLGRVTGEMLHRLHPACAPKRPE